MTSTSGTTRVQAPALQPRRAARRARAAAQASRRGWSTAGARLRRKWERLVSTVRHPVPAARLPRDPAQAPRLQAAQPHQQRVGAPGEPRQAADPDFHETLTARAARPGADGAGAARRRLGRPDCGARCCCAAGTARLRGTWLHSDDDPRSRQLTAARPVTGLVPAPERERAALPAAGRERQRLRDLPARRPRGTSRPGTPAPSASRATGADEIIGQHFSTLLSRRRTWRAAGRARAASAPPRTGASRTRAGACARTARASGPTSSSPRCATTPARWSASPRSRATSPSGAATRSSCARARSGCACWSTASRTTPSSCSMRTAASLSWNAGAEQHQRLSPATRSSASTSRSSIPPEDREPASRMRELAVARSRGRARGRGLARAQGRHALLGRLVDQRPARRATARLRGFANHARPDRPAPGSRTLEAEPRQRVTSSSRCSAHELRNPLAPIRNAVSMLQAAGTAAQRRHVDARHDRAARSTHLTRLVDDLLDVSRITRGKIELEHELARRCDDARAARRSSRRAPLDRRTATR